MIAMFNLLNGFGSLFVPDYIGFLQVYTVNNKDGFSRFTLLGFIWETGESGDINMCQSKTIYFFFTFQSFI